MQFLYWKEKIKRGRKFLNYSVLDSVNSPEDLKKLDKEQLNILATEIRDVLVNTVSKTGGHLSANLGVVELTIALHSSFNSPEDSIIFDVGHQCYTHKILTGRKDEFNTLRCEDGISGFLKPDESDHDKVTSGHSSTSVSSAYGINVANQLLGNKAYSVAVIGDGAFTGGMVYEALNNAGKMRKNFIVVLNDNKMSISKNNGAISRHLATMRSKKGYFRFKSKFERFISKIPFIGKCLYKIIFHAKQMVKNALYHSNMFESLGFQYMGPIDGHDIEIMKRTFETAKELNKPVLVHVKTVKGKGYKFAENDPCTFHGISGFDALTGETKKSTTTFSDVFSNKLCELAEKDEKICAITAAMCEGTGLNEFSKRFKNRFFDVGIAEEHAVTFSAGLTVGGMKPVFAVYSTFLQRAYDQVLHDAAIANVPLTICVDRAGIVGNDGVTHQGLFDVSFLLSIPNVNMWFPSCFNELEEMLSERMDNPAGVCALRYPRGSEKTYGFEYKYNSDDYTVTKCNKKADCVIVTYGRLYFEALKAAFELNENGCAVDVIKINKSAAVGNEFFREVMNYKNVYFFEEGIKAGGLGERVGCSLMTNNFKGIYRLTAIDGFVPQASVDNSTKKYNLDCDSIKKQIERDFVD